MTDLRPPPEQVRRVASMVQFIIGYFNHHEATDQEQIAIGLTLCQAVFDRKGISTEIAAAEFKDGLDALRALTSKQLN